MKVEVETPEENTGDVIDLSRRRGMLRGQESEVTGAFKIHAEVPLSEMFRICNSAAFSDQGRASYTMEFLKYDDAPSLALLRPLLKPVVK